MSDNIDNNLSLESLYEPFYRKNGIRFLAKMSSPVVHPYLEWEIPRLSILHYRPVNEQDYGISTNHWMLTNWNKYKWVYHVENLTLQQGAPKKRVFNTVLAIKAYRKVYPTLKWFRNEKMMMLKEKDPNSLWIINYGFADKKVRYRTIPMIDYFKWQNKTNTFWKEVEHLAQMSNRQQFVEWQVPTALPTRALLNRSSEELKRMHMNVFNSESMFELLDFWRWLNPSHRKLSQMSNVSERHLYKVNIVFTVSGNFIVLNLGKLNEWLSGQNLEDLEEKEEEQAAQNLNDDNVDDSNDQEDEGSAWIMIQKRFLRFLMLLNEMRVAENTTTVVTDENKQIEYHATNDVEVEGVSDTVDDEGNDVQPETTEGTSEGETQGQPQTDEVSTVDVDETKVEDTNTETQDKIPPELVTEKDPESGKITVKYLAPSERREILLKQNKLLQQIEGTAAANALDFKHGFSAGTSVSKQLTDEAVANVDAKIEAQENPQQIEEDIVVTSLVSPVRNKAIDLVARGAMSSGEMKRIEAMARSFEKIKDPYGSGKTLKEFVETEIPEVEQPPEESFIDQELVVDKSMLKASTKNRDKTYIEKVLKRDIARAVLSVQKAGVAVTSYEVEDIEDAASKFERHSIQVTPVGGATSTVHIKVPKIDENGVMKVNNSNYYLRKLRQDKVVRKVAENKSSLTTYYGKLFISRCERGKYNFDRWFLNQIELQLLNDQWKKPIYGSFKHPKLDLPREIIAFSSRYNKITSKEFDITLDMQNIEETSPGEFLIGEDKLGNKVYCIRKDNVLKCGEVEIPLARFFNIDINDRPVEFAEMGVLGEKIPVGLILARKYGLSKLCELLKEKPIKMERGVRVQLTPDQYSIKFADEQWIFDRNNVIASLIIGGLKNYDKYLKGYQAHLFEEKDVYGSILLDEGLNIRYENEMDLMDNMFVDDVSKQILEKMGEPTEFSYLLIRACELLLKGVTPREINMDDMRIAGYDRISGTIYQELVKAARAHMLKPITAKRRFDINPNEVWMAIQKDPAMELVDRINPIKNLKEKENVTFTGNGGRSKRSMTKPTRSYDETDLGTISEATVDSSDVGITTFLTANPKFSDLYGNTDRVDPEHADPATILSTVAMLSPCSDVEDSKRILFSSIQAEHKIAIKGLMPMPVCTGYERVVAHRVDNWQCFVAKEDGVISELSPDLLKVTYKSGTEEIVEIGTRFDKSKGSTYKRTLECDSTVGEKFKKGDVLVYNNQFFVRDILNPGQVVMTTQTLASTALIEATETLEDGSAISERFAASLVTPKIETKCVTLEAKNTILSMSKVGDEVDFDDILCTIEDQVFSDSGLYSDQASDALRRMGMYTPKSPAKGKIANVEVYYFCDYEDMSESVRQIVIGLDRRKTKIAKLTKSGDFPTGQVSEMTTIDGEKLVNGSVLFKFYIETIDEAGAGDKLAFGNQLKNTVTRRLTGRNETESGRPVDAWFGYQSIANRIVQSPEILGTTNSLLRKATERALTAYDS